MSPRDRSVFEYGFMRLKEESGDEDEPPEDDTEP